VAYSNPQSYTNSGSGTSGSVTISTAPSPGQLLVACIVAESVTSGFVAPTGWSSAMGSLEIGTTGWWFRSYYKVATGSETTVPFSWSGASSGAWFAEVDEFDGFIGTPTIDPNVVGRGESGTANSGGSESVSGLPVAPSLAVSYLLGSGNLGGAVTGTGNSDFETSLSGFSDITKFAFAIASAQTQLIGGWVQDTGDAAGATSSTWNWTWNTSRAWGLVGMNFYDPLAGLPSVLAQKARKIVMPVRKVHPRQTISVATVTAVTLPPQAPAVRKAPATKRRLIVAGPPILTPVMPPASQPVRHPVTHRRPVTPAAVVPKTPTVVPVATPTVRKVRAKFRAAPTQTPIYVAPTQAPVVIAQAPVKRTTPRPQPRRPAAFVPALTPVVPPQSPPTRRTRLVRLRTRSVSPPVVPSAIGPLGQPPTRRFVHALNRVTQRQPPIRVVPTSYVPSSPARPKTAPLRRRFLPGLPVVTPPVIVPLATAGRRTPAPRPRSRPTQAPIVARVTSWVPPAPTTRARRTAPARHPAAQTIVATSSWVPPATLSRISRLSRKTRTQPQTIVHATAPAVVMPPASTPVRRVTRWLRKAVSPSWVPWYQPEPVFEGPSPILYATSRPLVFAAVARPLVFEAVTRPLAFGATARPTTIDATERPDVFERISV
jgi:hypothetical protein